MLEPLCKIIEGRLRGLGGSPADEMKTWSRAVSGERAEGSLNALHPFPSPPCWAPLTLLLRPQAPGGGSRHAGGAGWRAGGRARPRKKEGARPGLRRQRAKAFALGGRKIARERPNRQGREPGAPWRSQPHSNQGFFPRLAHALPSCPPLLPSPPALPSCLPFPPVNKYLPGQRTPRAGSRWTNFLEHQNRPSVSPLRSGYGALSLLFKKGNVALPKI